jgi:hypothetical protein
MAPAYHAPSDDVNQAFNFDAPVESMQINFLAGYDIAQTQQRPTWKPGDFFAESVARKYNPGPGGAQIIPVGSLRNRSLLETLSVSF